MESIHQVGEAMIEYLHIYVCLSLAVYVLIYIILLNNYTYGDGDE